jgi:hypothetical protein
LTRKVLTVSFGVVVRSAMTGTLRHLVVDVD